MPYFNAACLAMGTPYNDRKSAKRNVKLNKYMMFYSLCCN
jgi:hypothetical protein